MKTIGLIGGMSWESTQVYYRLINQRINERLGGFHSARLIINSIDFDPIVTWQKADDWHHAGLALAQAASQLQKAGCEIIAIGTNTMHLVADAVQAAITVPLLHIAEPTGQALARDKHHRIALLGTRFTMEKTFYRDYLQQHFAIESVIPEPAERDDIHQIIYNELCRGQINTASRQRYQAIISRLAQEGATAVIFGCTEIGLLLATADSALPVYDTTQLHAQVLADASIQH